MADAPLDAGRLDQPGLRPTRWVGPMFHLFEPIRISQPLRTQVA
ncbi:MAG: hypothetical protein U0R23_09430 [Candidatus Nanopelagicales bacterium]